MRLLFVEDDPDLNRQLATALTDAGYVVDRAFDGEEGHYLGETEPYDAVILDIGFPHVDGLSALEAWGTPACSLAGGAWPATPRASAIAARCGSTPALAGSRSTAIRSS